MEYSYLFAIIPPSPQLELIEAVRREFAANFPSEEALRRPVHATLYQPFGLPAPMAPRDIAAIADWVGRQPAFDLALHGFGFFDTPKHPVIFIDVVHNPLLHALNSGLSRILRQRFAPEEPAQQHQGFRPHFTIGFRDLDPQIFPAIRRAYRHRPFRTVFLVDQVVLFRYVGRKHRLLWEPFQRMPLGVARQGALW